MEVLIRDEEKDKYESFAFSAYYHKYRIGEENTGKKNCLVQDFWSDDSEDLPKLSVKSLEQHDLEIRAEERKKVVAELEEWVDNNKTLVVWGTNNHNNFESVDYFDLQQKLAELKGD